MRHWYFVTLIAGFLAAPAMAQQGADVTAEGRRLYEQHCGVCHARILHVNVALYAPELHTETVTGREAAMAELIAEGTPRMPGFKHMFDKTEIASIVAYLKTRPKPAQPQGAGVSGERED
jgi:mono/diheme cytochrome c family protein